MRRLGHDLRRQLAESARVIENVDAAAMSGDDEIGCARVNLQIVHPNVRQIADPHPARALVEGGEQAKVRSRVEQIWVDRIFAHNFHRIVRRKPSPTTLCQVFPRSAVRRIVGRSSPAAIGVRHQIGDLRILGAGFDPHDPLPARRFRNICGQLRPIASVVFRHPEPAVIRSRPEQAGS